MAKQDLWFSIQRQLVDRRSSIIVAIIIAVSEPKYIIEEGVTIIGFPDDPNDPVRYVVLEMSDHPDESELEHGGGGVRLDTGEIGLDGYDMVQSIRRDSQGIVIMLTAEAALQGNVDAELRIELADMRIVGAKLDDVLQRFNDRIVSWDEVRSRA